MGQRTQEIRLIIQDTRNITYDTEQRTLDMKYEVHNIDMGH